MSRRLCDVENLSDFHRYYHNSWVGWNDPENGSVTPVAVGHMYDTERVQLKFLHKAEGDKFSVGDWQNKTMADLYSNLDFGRPSIGMTEDEDTVIFLSYSTPRAPYKGLRTRDTRIHMFNDKDTRVRARKSINSERYDWIWQAFNPKYEGFKAAYKLLDEGKK